MCLLNSTGLRKLPIDMVMVFSNKMIHKFWSAVPRSGWFELGSGESFKCGLLHSFSSVAVVLLWNTAGYLNYKKREDWIAANLAFMFIFYVCSILVMVGIVKHKKSLLIPALICFPLTCLFSAALFFAGIYFQTQG